MRRQKYVDRYARNDHRYYWYLIRKYHPRLEVSACISSNAETETDLTKNEKERLTAQLREQIKMLRSERRALHRDVVPHMPREFGPRVGGAYEKPGTFTQKEIIHGIKRAKVTSHKVPKTKVHHVGIEFECLSYLNEAALIEKVIAANLHNYLSVGGDGSVKNVSDTAHDEDCSRGRFVRCDCGFGRSNSIKPYEIRALIPQDELESALKQICKFFNRHKMCVNRTCGMHVHIDVRNRDFPVAVTNLIFCQKILFSLVPKLRRTNDYCRPTYRLTDPQQIEKYSAIHGGSFTHRKTIEVRLHHGCINFKKVFAWVKLLCAIVDTPEIKEPISTLKQFRQIKLDPDHRVYLLLRMKKFSRAKTFFPKTAKEWAAYDKDHFGAASQNPLWRTVPPPTPIRSRTLSQRFWNTISRSN